MKNDNFTDAERSVIELIRRKITGKNVMKDIIDDIFPDIQKIIPCDRLDVAFVEENGNRIEINYTAAVYQPKYLNIGYTEDIKEIGGLLKKVLATRGYSIINELYLYHKRSDQPDWPLLYKEDGILSCIILPVPSTDTINAILLCGSIKSNAFDKHHASILHEIAVALSNIVEKIYKQNLFDQNYQAYMEMLSFISHELKNPISSIITLGRTLLDGYYGKIDEKQRDILSRILKKGEYLFAVSNKFLNLSKIESNITEIHPQLVDYIEDVIEPVIEVLAPQIDESSMKLERDYNNIVLPVKCDPDLIKIVVMNLISNGIRYGNKGGSLKISIKKGFKRFSTLVWNEGLGFSEQDKYLLFKKFSRLRSKELYERKGSGIGLYVSWKIIHLHGGRIHAESKEGSWAEFSFDLPQYMDICLV